MMATISMPAATGNVYGYGAPVLKWLHGGCYSSWCETGWYASPAVADLDNDGRSEIIGAAYTIFALNGEDGSVLWSLDPAGGRVWPGVVVADLENDGNLEIITAHGDGYLHVMDRSGSSVWSRHPTDIELRGLAVSDIDGDQRYEIIVTGAVLNKQNSWVYESDGTLRPGWPQLSDSSGYAYGVFNDNAAIGDLDADGIVEIVIPSDVHYICAYTPNGQSIQAHAMYGDKAWGAVGIWESLNTALRGWGYCDGVRQESYRTNFAHGAASIADVDGDGIREVIVTGNVYDCSVGHPPGKYTGLYIFNPDRSRFQSAGFDWRTPPVDTGTPLAEDYNIIESAQPNPVAADLDGDGRMEILFSSYDGRVHAYWLDKTEHYHWPFVLYDAGQSYFQFAGEPVVADLDNDGFAEVIFTSWTQKGSGRTGKLYVVNYEGLAVFSVDLPAAFGSPDWNGALPAPTLADIDQDADLEVLVNTAHSGFVAYDIPDSANARILWGTGRGNYHRNGASDGLNSNQSIPPIKAKPDPESGGSGGCFIKLMSWDVPLFSSISGVCIEAPAKICYASSQQGLTGRIKVDGVKLVEKVRQDDGNFGADRGMGPPGDRVSAGSQRVGREYPAPPGADP